MTLLFQGKVEVLEEHETVVRTVRFSYRLPSILRLNHFVKSRAQNCIRFSRENIYIRDEFTCQYCGERYHPKRLTLDHVVPAVQGGAKSWTNIVTACMTCNQRKGGRTPAQASMKLLSKPREPAWLPKVQINFSIANTPETWRAYLSLVANF
ncbi:MAG: HNH endonuclease [Oligoflexia bacterium]|nr:HNH endonuclease [Oligoflexia bacterium]